MDREPDTPNSVLPWSRIVFFGVAFFVVAYWLSTSDGDSAALARSFLRNLFRQLF